MNNQIKYSINDISENEIQQELNRIASLNLSSFTYIRTPICITLDLSGSMKYQLSTLKTIIRLMDGELRVVQKHDFTLIIMGIYCGVPRVLYFGDLHTFDLNAFLDSLPDTCLGRTPLATSLIKSDELLTRLNEVYEKNNYWYTIPVFFSITDSQATDSVDDCTIVAEKFKKDIIDNNKLVVEFVTCSNPNGLNLGGYKVIIDKPESLKTIHQFMQSLRIATSTVKNLKDAEIVMPVKRDRIAYNRYMSDVLICNFKYCYERNSN